MINNLPGRFILLQICFLRQINLARNISGASVRIKDYRFCKLYKFQHVRVLRIFMLFVVNRCTFVLFNDLKTGKSSESN